PPDAKALSIQFDGNRNENQGGRGREGNFRGRGGHKVRGRGRSGISKRYSRPEFNPNKYCTRCEKQGHDIDICWTAARERESTNAGSDDRSFQPSFTRPSYSA